MIDWTVARLALAKLIHALDPVAVDKLRACGGRPVLVACSGGADSVALLLVLWLLFEGGEQQLIAAYFNHGQRSESVGEAEFVKQLSGELGVLFRSGESSLVPGASESELREARYAWLESVYAEVGAGALCLGHHADDCLETQLLALLRGSGPAGLAAPAAMKRFADGHVRVRPFVRVERRQIIEALESAGIAWCEDESNANQNFTRNWVRHEWLPLVKARGFRNLAASSLRTRKLMQESVDAIDAMVEQLGVDRSDPAGFDATPLNGQPLAVCRRLFMSWWLAHYEKEQLGSDAIDAIVTGLSIRSDVLPVTIPGGDWVMLNTAGRLVRKKRLEHPRQWRGFRFWVPESGPLYLPDKGWLQGERIELSEKEARFWQANSSSEAWLSGYAGPLDVRFWQPGDRYRPLGAPGRRKLQDLFTDKGIPVELRHRLPVIATDKGAILWIPGFPPAEEAKVAKGSKSALRLTYHVPCSPFENSYG